MSVGEHDAALGRLAEASFWQAHLADRDLETSPGFEAWLVADAANPVALRHVEAGWIAVGEQSSSPDLLHLRRDALRRAQRAGRSRRVPSRRVAAMAICLIFLLVTGFGGGAWWRSVFPPSYQTASGERRTITLDDGSRVSLDASSRLEVRYTKQQRKLVLLAGQARFDVAHNPLRPFLVEARGRTVVATGTAFNIDLLGPVELVTLIEGRVVITPSREAAPPLAAFRRPPPGDITLTPGQQAIFRPASRATLATIDLRRTGAWEAGMLDFDDEPLASVATRINRYSRQQVVVSPTAADMRISGVFQTGDTATFVDAVSHYLPVSATDRGADIVIAARNPRH
ncbi:FecR family protein [Sphingomonas bacterium]|uniref:FecR family protein n=1 Tax=Sphingomonas bacterium TaxID=1895847 RepID=UPI0015766723|nr:FecR domain-containing protein [Sphingomonas bacterium]